MFLILKGSFMLSSIIDSVFGFFNVLVRQNYVILSLLGVYGHNDHNIHY
uniref:Uncharacterized protein n=1 Tax=Anguilla anguilla TaxID=7936 RepID=A0A0E9RQJ5_ANGAN